MGQNHNSFVHHFRYRNSVHLETKNVGNDHRQRYIVVSKVIDEADFKKREAAKQEAEWVSKAILFLFVGLR